MREIRRQYQSKNGKCLGPGLDVRNIFLLPGGTDNQTIPHKGKQRRAHRGTILEKQTQLNKFPSNNVGHRFGCYRRKTRRYYKGR